MELLVPKRDQSLSQLFLVPDPDGMPVRWKERPVGGSREALIDEELMNDMDLIIKVCRQARSARNNAGIKLRQPLREVMVVAEKRVLERLKRFADVVKDELNVKDLKLTTRERELVDYEIILLPQVLGKKHGRLFPKLQDAVAAMDADTLLQTLKEHERVEVALDDKVVALQPEEIEVRTRSKEGYVLSEEEGIIVGVYTEINEDLKMEGLAREIVRRIQNQRKEAGLDIADHINVYYNTEPAIAEVFNIYGDYIASETLSKSIRQGEPPGRAHVAQYRIDGKPLKIMLISEKS